MAKKLDFAALKQRAKRYFFENGERVGLVVCACIAVLLVGVGIWNGFTSSRPPKGDTWPKLLESEASTLGTKVTTKVLAKEVADKPKHILDNIRVNPWGPVRSLFQGTPWIALIEGADTRRRNPVVLPVLRGEKDIQIDYLVVGVRAYDVDFKKKLATAGKLVAGKGSGGKVAGGGKGGGTTTGQPTNNDLAVILKPHHVAVVTAVFPLKEQLEEFRKALRLPTLESLVANPENIPQALGLNVYRCEVLADGKTTDWEPLIRYNPKTETTELAERIDIVLRESHLDNEINGYYGPHIRSGFLIPLPKLVHGQYPKLTLDGIEGVFPEGEKKPIAGDPKNPGDKFSGIPVKGEKKVGKGDTQETDTGIWDTTLLPWSKLPADLKKKFEGKDPLFEPTIEKGAKGGKTDFQGMLFGGGKGPKNPDAKAPQKKDKQTEVEIPDAIVRFFDVDLVPGKVYRYAIQVRMQNPNFGNKDVAFKELAEKKELDPADPSKPFTLTPEFRVPGDYYFYAVDHMPDVFILYGSDKDKQPKDRVAVQVHRFVTETKDGTIIGDWAIAERLLQRRGDYVGRSDVYVEVPFWSISKGRFEIGKAVRPKGLSAEKSAIGTPINFQDTPSPILVDFTGGGKKDEAAAVEMLVLNPDGKLIVRNSRVDTEEDNPIGKERHTRFTAWHERIRELRAGGTGPIRSVPVGNGPGGKIK